ncbi:hypothetical protein [Halolamina salina]|uniref:Uncharacterized protein n=1 Tax=Halolamina salina TaxID=1220023 RepID=A0ABD6B5Q5_9EURY
MTERTPSGGSRETVEWRRLSPGELPSPIVRRLPYLELKLEHPELEPSGIGDRFFPDAVPYELDGTRRVFYWRPSMASSAGEPSDWELACATTHELRGVSSLPADAPRLVTRGDDRTVVAVDGTIGGESTTTVVSSYSVPDVSVENCSDSAVELTVDGAEYSIAAGERRQIALEERHVELVGEDGESTSVTPEIGVRFPGRRELHHPAHGATYRLFPSFDIDVDQLPNPLPIPTAARELDDTALAEALGVDLSRRPYPERVLWQAFAHTAFGRHTGAEPELAQLATGHIGLRIRESRTE